jgi:SAM-dependent methyltransferase
MLDEAAERARRTYDAAADHYDEPGLAFWARSGARTVERLRLAPGAVVLDTPCGSGASALPAARAVGPQGSVTGADVSEGLLGLAAAKAKRAGVANLDLRVGDMRALGYPDGSFDAVVSVFGVFFAPDMPALVAELWRMVRPGGVLAVTTWGPGAFEPGSSAFWDAVGEVQPDLVRTFNPWDEVVTPGQLLDVFERAGIGHATADAEAGEQPMRGAGDWWALVLGTGFRGTVDTLAPAERAHVEQRVRTRLADGPPANTPLVLGTAHKPR